MDSVIMDSVPAPVYKRAIAYVIDAAAAFLPMFVVILFLTSNYNGYAYFAPALYPVPVAGTAVLISVPLNVNKTINTFENDTGGTYSDYDVSLGATCKRVFSWLAVAMYPLYSAFLTYLYDGQTFGKYLMRIRVTAPESKKPGRTFLCREILGKVLLCTIPVVPIISVFTIIFTKERLSLHDIIFKTRVVE